MIAQDAKSAEMNTIFFAFGITAKKKLNRYAKKLACRALDLLFSGVLQVPLRLAGSTENNIKTTLRSLRLERSPGVWDKRAVNIFLYIR
jgi:hypothetical protein